jgi:hypothetical protein
MTAEPKTAPPPAGSGELQGVAGSPFPRSSLAGGEVPKRRALAVWLWRIRALLFVTVCATFGVLLVILPWTSKWSDNALLLTSPNLRQFVLHGFVRGLASGVGLLDLWLGFWEAIHYHESPD